jgi:hypothetical protein
MAHTTPPINLVPSKPAIMKPNATTIMLTPLAQVGAAFDYNARGSAPLRAAAEIRLVIYDFCEPRSLIALRRTCRIT